MTNDKGILIKNIYYMLSYAFQVLKQETYESIAAEDFENAQDLFAAILARGVARQLKQGLYREYVTQYETLSVMRGKLDMPETIRNRIQHKQKLGCEFDELTEDNLLNQILKTTMHYLVKDNGVKGKHKAALKKILLFFDEVTLLEPSMIVWNRLQYQRNNQNYEMLINICYLVMKGLLQTTEKGDYKMMTFSDEYMATLYEKFVLEYYRQEFPQLHANDIWIRWVLDDEERENLPGMHTDITLSLGNTWLIIDTKYYEHTMSASFNGNCTQHSGNLYQLFAYVKNKEAELADKPHTVSGMLLYARTEEAAQPNNTYRMSGNRIDVRTLDLNCDFSLIRAQLDRIVEEFFGLRVNLFTAEGVN